MRIIRRFILAACVALLLNSTLRSPGNLPLPAHAVNLGSLLARAVTATPRPAPVSTVASTARPTPTPHAIPLALNASTTILAYPPPPVRALAAFLVDLETGATLFSKNADARLPMASTTKITTAVLALQHLRLNEMVTVSRNAAGVGQSTMGLRAGERVTVLQLLYGLMLNSGNDAAVALAERVAGSQTRFVGMMNRLARTLGMRNTHYETPHGLDHWNHYTSARDLATISQYAMRDPRFRAVVATASYHVPATRHNHEHWLASVNKVMYWYPGVDGVKPGNTDAAGLCQVVSVTRDGRHLLAVLLNTPNLVTDIRNLLNYGLHDFRWVQGPAWWDTPDSPISGGPRYRRWTFYPGAGHYVRGLFLDYFATHGGLHTLGYPRTEEIVDTGRRVQFFQGGELAYDPAHRSVYPVNLGRLLAQAFAPRDVAGARSPGVARDCRRLYRLVGGSKVLGLPVTGLSDALGYSAQYFEYGEIAMLRGSPYLVAVGDTALRLRQWLPLIGAADVFPAPMTPSVAVKRNAKRFKLRQNRLVRHAVHRHSRASATNSHRHSPNKRSSKRQQRKR